MNKTLIIIVVAITLAVSYTLKINNDMLYFLFLIFWVYYGRVKRIDGRNSVLIGISLLLICPFIFNLNQLFVQKISIWSFLFLLSGTILLLIDKANTK